MKDFGIFSHAITQTFINIYLSGLFGTKLSIVKSKSTTSESAILYFVIFQVNSNFSRILAPLYFDDEFTKELLSVTKL